MSRGEGDNPTLASPGGRAGRERQAEMAQGKRWDQVGCPAACFSPCVGMLNHLQEEEML